MIITIMGPAASGKGTIAHLIAKRLGLVHIDAGLVFRALAWLKSSQNDELIDVNEISEIIQYTWDPACGADVALYGETLTSLMKQDQVALIAAEAARQSDFFATAKHTLERIATKFDRIVCDGRNAGTELFADADHKIFLDADVEQRAQRRHQQLKKSESEITLDTVLAQMKARDKSDKERQHAPFRAPSGAFVLDNSLQTPDETVEEIIKSLGLNSQ